MIRGLPRVPRLQVRPMNVPVHQIMFTSDRDSVPPPAAQAIRSNAGGNPYRLWSLDDARELIRDAYGPEILRALDNLRPYSYKADLARYCIVNHIGGIYLALSVTDFRSFDVGNYEFVGFRDPNNAETSWKVGNHMFYSTKDSPNLQASISECVEKIHRRFYGKDPHFPTGPSVLGRAVANYSTDVRVQIGDYWWLKRRRNKYTLPGQGVIARGKVGGRRLGGVSGVVGGNNYNVMWRERSVYGGDDLCDAAQYR
jgi:mannosyltransferase OCH1-like enzyme